MKYETPLLEGILLKRYKRFLADVKLSDTGKTVLVHVPNTGSMLGVKDPGSFCRISISKNLKRKIPYTLEMVRTKEGAWVGVNTSITNTLVAEAFELKTIKHWKKFDKISREVKISDDSRLDIVLSNKNKKCFIEVKNVSMAYPPSAVFPDAVTKRGQKHLLELAKLVKKGHLAEIFFVVQREDCVDFRPCDEIDAEYGKLLRLVSKAGVKIQCWTCKVTPEGIWLSHSLPINLDDSRVLTSRN
ncbi:MAG: DNA/RNA nuclease SfsA [Oligoflexia bacterium]|nr:DNA/RNA nuclease SfsA [Oligoflexia bacterium]